MKETNNADSLSAPVSKSASTGSDDTQEKKPPQLEGTTSDDRPIVINLYDDDTSPFMEMIKDQLMTVYDPEFPLIDIFTLGLVYVITIDQDSQHIEIIMTYTTPACPAGDLIQQMMHNALNAKLPEFTVSIDVTFDPQWTLDMIKDQDLRRIFE